MIASKRSPIKTLLLASGLSASLALLGCATNGLSPLADVQPVPGSQTGQTSVRPAQAAPLPVPGNYDWSSDRVLRSSGFRTTSFSDAIKPALEIPAVEREVKNPSLSGGFANSFAKDLPSANGVNYLPNTPAVDASGNTYFLTASEASANFFSLSPGGGTRWDLSLHDNGKFVDTSPAFGKDNPNTLFVATDQGRLYAINANSGLVTTFIDIPEASFSQSSPFVIDMGADDYVYLASQEGDVYRVTFNGNSFSNLISEEIADNALSGRFSSSPVGLNHLYIGSEEGVVYKLEQDLDIVGEPLDLATALRSEGCQVRATLAIDEDQDVGLVPCGSYLFKVRLSDSSSASLGLVAQSPLLEVKQLLPFKPTRVLGPNFANRPLFETTILRDPEPTEAAFSLEQTFGFKEGDFVRVTAPNDLGFLYAQIDEISEEGELSFIGDGLYPLVEPTPDPVLFGGETVRLANLVVRPTPVPEEDAVTPTPTPTPAASDPVTQFQIGNKEDLQAGDYIRFPSLNNQVFQICSSTNTACDRGDGTRYPGLEQVSPSEDAADDELVWQVTVPGEALADEIADAMADTRYVPIERVQNQVIGTNNSTTSFALGSTKDFKSGDVIRVTHSNGSEAGRFEYATLASNPSNGRLTVTSETALLDAPQAGDQVDIIDPNNRAYGRVTSTQMFSSGNILSDPVLRGNGQQAYVQHGNMVFELNYANDTSFKDSASYVVLQSGRLDQSNTALTALSRSRPLVVGDKLVTVDTDVSNKTGIYLNRVLLPLSSSVDRLNDLFPILAPNSLGQLPNRAETGPVLLNSSDSVVFGGGNGVAYKLHKDIAW
ncbi:MAG: hypothetical protein ACO1RX_09455 [Candidatus Sericytochromatia bacterium]